MKYPYCYLSGSGSSKAESEATISDTDRSPMVVSASGDVVRHLVVESSKAVSLSHPLRLRGAGGGIVRGSACKGA